MNARQIARQLLEGNSLQGIITGFRNAGFKVDVNGNRICCSPPKRDGSMNDGTPGYQEFARCAEEFGLSKVGEDTYAGPNNTEVELVPTDML